MDYKHRIHRLSIFLFLLLAGLGAGVYYQMIVAQKPLSQRGFVDEKQAAMIRDLADLGIIRPGSAGVEIDDKKLREQVQSPGLRQYIIDRKPYMSFSQSEFILDPAAVSVSNRRLINSRVMADRGRFFDRNMEVLAQTSKTGKGKTFRQYPGGKALFPLLGVAHSIYGKKGLELYLDGYLAGTEEQGVLGLMFRMISGRRKNCDIVLTIDKHLQTFAFDALNGRSGAVVVLDVATGEILAAASAPSFDPGTPTGIAWDKEEQKGDKGAFINRAFGQRYPPGSTFKLVAAAALLEDETFDPNWGMECKGVHPKYMIREHDLKRHGWVSLKNAVALSCNVFFAEVGVRLGPDLLAMAEKFGFNHGFRFTDQGRGQEPVLTSLAFTNDPSINGGKKWRPQDFKQNPKLVAQCAVGQNAIAATPLQVALIGACIGNHGVLKAPVLLNRIQFSKDESMGESLYNVDSFHSKTFGRVMSRKTAGLILDMMKEVTGKGTAYSLKKLYRSDDGYETTWKLPKETENVFAGKTGTAETGRGTRDHSWFLGVAPVENPKYSVAVIIENGGYGAKAAGPVALEVMKEALNSEL